MDSRRQLSTAPLPATGDETRALWRAIQVLVRRFSLSERAEVSCCGMTVAQAATLQALRASGPMRLGDLARRLGISPSTVSRNLERLERRGLVERFADRDDGRAARARLTGQGAAAALGLERQTDRFAESILGELPPQRRSEVLRSLEDLLAAVRRATESCCPGAFDHLAADSTVNTETTRRENDEPPDHQR